MFDAISRLFALNDDSRADPPDAKLAVAALLVHLASVDGEFSPEERIVVKKVLSDHFELDEGEVRQLIEEAAKRDAEAVDFYHFTSEIKKLDEDERVEIIKLMWQVVFADNENHELEDNMVWRVAELIGVSSRQRTILRNQIRKS